MKLSVRSLLVVIAFVPLATGMNGNCSGFMIPDVPTCGTSNVPAVQLTIVNDDGQTLPYATIAFSVDQGQYYVGTCQNNCSDFAVAYDVSGRFDISVIAPGYLQDDKVVNVGTEADECTPVTQDVVVVLKKDTTVAVLAGVWRAQTVYGTIDLRFGNNGEAIGAILYDRTVAGDGNIYVSYNGSPIKGVAGQEVAVQNVNDPTRVGDIFNFNGQALGVPVGFVDAQLSTDFYVLSGAQPGAQSQGLFVSYSRLTDIPTGLQDP